MLTMIDILIFSISKIKLYFIQQRQHQKIINKIRLLMRKNQGRNKQIIQRTSQIYQKEDRKNHKHTQKTIQQLKQSIGSIQKMIEKSQQILRNTRPLNPREIRSDSLELRLKNDSREKINRKINCQAANPQLDKLSATSYLKNINLNSTLNTQNRHVFKQNGFGSRLPLKQRPIRPHLFIDTDDTHGSIQENTNRSKVLINYAVSPMSTISGYKQRGEQSFADSLQSPFNFGRRLKTEAINDSYQRSLEQSIQKGSNTRIKSVYYMNGTGNQDLPIKRIILRKRKCARENNHLRNISQMQHKPRKSKRKSIFPESQKREIQKQGQFSYYDSKPQINFYKNTEKSKITSSKQQYATYDSRQVIDNYHKQNKQNESEDLQHFCERLKQFGFVQRYLNTSEIASIHQYLRKSSIPQHKWPLYVVDRVYEKMNTMPKHK